MPDLSLSVLTYLGASWTDAAAAGATIFLLKKFIVVLSSTTYYIIMDKSLLYLYISRYFQVLGKTAL